MSKSIFFTYSWSELQTFIDEFKELNPRSILNGKIVNSIVFGLNIYARENNLEILFISSNFEWVTFKRKIT